MTLLLTWKSTAQASTNLISTSFTSLQSAVAVGGTIVLNFDGTVTVTSPLVISNNTVLLTFTNNVVLNGSGTNRLFQVLSNVSLTLSTLTLSGGNITSSNGIAGTVGTVSGGGSNGKNGSAGAGGTNAMGGAVFNQGSTLAYTCLFLTNTATGTAGGAGGAGGPGSSSNGNGGNGGAGGNAFGGAIYNLGTLLLSNCTMAGNGCIAGAGGLGGAGGTNGNAPTGFPGVGGVGGSAIGAGLTHKCRRRHLSYRLHLCL